MASIPDTRSMVSFLNGFRSFAQSYSAWISQE